MRFQLIQQLHGEHAVSSMCRMLGVSRSGFHAWQRRPESPRSRQGWLYLAALMDLFSRRIVGWATSER